MPQQLLSNSESFGSKRDFQSSASPPEKPGTFSVPALKLSAIRKQLESILTRNGAFIEPMECHRFISEEIYFVSKIHKFAVLYRGFECGPSEVFGQHRTRQLNLGMLGFTKVCFWVCVLVLVRPPAGAALSITPITTYLVMLTGAALGGSIFVGAKAFLVSFSGAIQLDGVTVRLRGAVAEPSDLPRAIGNLISLADRRTRSVRAPNPRSGATFAQAGSGGNDAAASCGNMSGPERESAHCQYRRLRVHLWWRAVGYVCLSFAA